MSEGEAKPPQQPSVVWMIDEPTPFASRAEWEEHLAGLKTIAAERGPHPQIEAAIARAEAAVKVAPVY